MGAEPMRTMSASTSAQGDSEVSPPANETADSADRQTGDRQMQTLSFMLGFVLVLAGPTLVGPSDGNVPGIGTFAYNGSPIVTSVPQAIVVATR